MSVILTVGTLPQVYPSGTWPITILNSGVWRFTFTPTLASTDSSFSGFITLAAANDLGGLWLVDRVLSMYNQSEVTVVQAPITWNAGQSITVTIDNISNHVYVSGALTGNGVYSITAEGVYFTDVSLGVGVYGGGGFSFSGTISNFDEGSGAPILQQALGAVTASSSGSVSAASINGTVDSPLGLLQSSASGTVPIVGSSSTILGLASLSSSGAVSSSQINGFLSSSLGVLSSSSSASVAVSGASSTSLGSLTVSSTGLIEKVLSLNKILGSLTLSSSTATEVNGSLSKSLGALTVSSGAVTSRIANASINLSPLSLVSNNNQSVSLGAFDGQRVLYGSAAGTVTTEPLTTQVSGSSFIVVTGGNLGDLSTPPTDSKGNTWTQVGTAVEYSRWSGYGIAVWRCIGGVGGVNHTFSQQYGQTLGFDECTICVAEVKNAGYLQGAVVNQVLTGGILTSGSLSTTAKAIMLAFFSGDAPTGATTTVSLSNGYTIIDTDTLPDDSNGYVPIAIGYAEKINPGTYNYTATETPDQGAIMVHVALQEVEGRVADLSKILGSLSVSSTAIVESSAVLNKTLGSLTSSSQGSVLIQGAASNVLETLQVSSTSSSATSGSAIISLSSMVLSSSGVVAIQGSSSSVLGSLSSSANASVAIKGNLSSNLSPITSIISGSVPIAGSLVSSLGIASVNSSASIQVQGVSSVVLGQLTLISSAANGNGLSLNSILGPLTSSAQASIEIKGTADCNLNPLQVAASAEVKITGSIDKTLSALTLTSFGFQAVGAVLSATLGPITSSISGSIDSIYLGELTAQSTGIVRTNSGKVRGPSFKSSAKNLRPINKVRK